MALSTSPSKDGVYPLVRFEERFVYADAVEWTLLHESRRQVEAVRRGLCDLVPPHVLSLFTWKELDELVCGRRGVDIALLRRHTKYQGYVFSSVDDVKLDYGLHEFRSWYSKFSARVLVLTWKCIKTFVSLPR